MFLSAAGQRRVAIESVNVERADLVVERVYRNNLHYLFQAHGYSVWRNDAYSEGHRAGQTIVLSQPVESGPSRRSPKALPGKSS